MVTMGLSPIEAYLDSPTLCWIFFWRVLLLLLHVSKFVYLLKFFPKSYLFTYLTTSGRT